MGQKDIAEKILESYNDAAEYRQQISGENSKNKTDISNDEGKNEVGETDVQRYYPVVSLVLYFGYEHPWNAPRKLSELLKIPTGMEGFVNDYQIHVYEIAWLDRQVIDTFKSDFGIVADYFWQKRVKKDYIPTTRMISHVQETLSMLSVMSGDHRFEEIFNEANREREVPRNMDEVLDRYINQGIEKGIEKGIQKGIISGRTEDIRNLMDSLKMTPDQAMDALKIPEAERIVLKAAL